MRLLYVCGTYAPGALSGSELSAHTLLRELAARGLARVRVVTDERYTGGRPGEGRHDGVELRGAAHADRREAIAAELDDFAPDVVLTQLVWADVALALARRRALPTIYRVASLPLGLDLRLGSEHAPTVVLAASAYVAGRIRAASGREAVVQPPAIDLARVVAPQETRLPRFVTMFNPIRRKGGEILREVARLLPRHEFAVVPGWSVLRAPDGRFDPEQLRRAYETHGLDYRGELPVDVDFTGLGNVTVLPPRERVAEIYAQTRVLVVPSLWEEAFGRVVLEGFANGIPVLTSPVGALSELGGGGGRVVEGHPDPAAWAEAIRALDEPREADAVARRGRDFLAASYALDRVVDRFAALARGLLPRRSTPRGRGSRPRVRLLVPYYGAWPEWMPLFLESCRWNPAIEWLLLSDLAAPGSLPPNVGLVELPLAGIAERIRKRLDIEPRGLDAYKLCDYRLAYGRLFEDLVEGAEWLGWGDLDVVYGDLAGYLTPERLDHELLSFNADHLSGHLTLVRNGEAARSLHLRLPGFRERAAEPDYRHLDEPAPAELTGSLRIAAEESFNTPLSPKIPWRDGRFVFPTAWTWRRGRLTNDLDGERDFPYLHFMHWKGGAWARACGNAQWESLDRLVHLDPAAAARGFRVDARGFHPLAP